MSRIEEAFPFQKGLRMLEERISDAGVAIEIRRAGEASMESALTAGVPFETAIEYMLASRTDLGKARDEMHNPDIIYNDSWIVDPMLAVIDRTRIRANRTVSRFGSYISSWINVGRAIATGELESR